MNDQPTSEGKFAAEHDPAEHDITAGEELRQKGDWIADEAGGPQVWDADGNLVTAEGPADAGRDAGGSRRISSLEEVRDGGYGIGSAAVIDDGAVPLGHPVKAWEDTRTFVLPDDPQYGVAEPHVWFTDERAAQAAGFRHAD